MMSRAFAAKSEFKVFKEAATKGGTVKALIVYGGALLPRSRIDALGETAKSFGAKGLAWLKITAEGQLESVIAKFLDAKAFGCRCRKRSPAIWCYSAPTSQRWCMMCWDVFRLLLGEELNLIDKTPGSRSGSPSFRCWTIRRKRNAISSCTTPLPHRWMKTCRSWIRSP